MASGIDILLKSLGINPDEIKHNVAQFADTMLSIQRELIIIRNQNSAMMAHFNIENPYEIKPGQPQLSDGRTILNGGKPERPN
jgi:hypothetical protein